MCEPEGLTPALLQFRFPAPALPPPALAALCGPLYSWTVPVRSLSFHVWTQLAVPSGPVLVPDPD